MDPVISRQETFNKNITENIRLVLNMVDHLRLHTEDAEPSVSCAGKDPQVKNTRVSPDLPTEETVRSWSQIYSRHVDESDLKNTVAYHQQFLNLIRRSAEKKTNASAPRVLEIGLGHALMSIWLSRDCNCDVWGIDNDLNVLNSCMKTNTRLGGHARFILMDAFDLDLLKDRYFDVAFSQGTLEHFDNKAIIALLEQQLRVARTVVFSVPSADWPNRERGDERKLPLEDWRAILSAGRFTIASLEYYCDGMQIAGVLTDRHSGGST
jgi:hypothetical protein